MSGLFSAISRGLSQAAYAAADMFAKQAEEERQMRLEEFRSGKTLERADALARNAEERAIQRQERQAQRIDQRAGLMAAEDVGVTPMRNEIEAGIVDRSSWTPEHQAAADQALGKPYIEAKKGRRIDAAVDLGVIEPKSLFDADSQRKLEQERTARASMQESRRDAREELKEEGRNAREELKEEGRNAREEKKQHREGNDPEARRIKHQITALESKRKAIANRADEKRKLFEQEFDTADRKNKENVRQKYEPLIKKLDEQRDKLDADLDRLFEQLEKKITGPDSEKREAPKSAPTSSSSRKSNFNAGQDNGNMDSPAAIINAEYRKTKANLANTTDPEMRTRLEGDLIALQEEAKLGGFALNDAAPAARTNAQAPESRPRNPDRLQSAASGPVRIANDADYAKLPSGTEFIGPDGKRRRKP